MNRVDQIANRILDDPTYATEPGVRDDLEHLLRVIWEVQQQIPDLMDQFDAKVRQLQIVQHNHGKGRAGG